MEELWEVCCSEGVEPQWAREVRLSTQEMRDRRALEAILERYILQETRPCTRTFPYEFYKQIFRLRGWPGLDGVKRPSIIGHYPNDIVYSRLPDGVLEELQRVNPSVHDGRKKRHHQWFTPDPGMTELNQHLAGVLALMRAAPNWDAFRRALQRVYPKRHEDQPLALGDDE